MKTSKILVLVMALMAVAIVTMLVGGGCTNEQATNPTMSAVTPSDNNLNPGDSTNGRGEPMGAALAGSVAWESRVLSEACYALSQSRSGYSNKSYGGNAMGDWPYPWQGDCCDALGVVTRKMYSVASDRGLLGLWSGQYQQGGECKFFVNLVLYRSSYGYPGGHLILPGGTYTYSGSRDWRNAGPGWIIQSASMPHTAIVVANYGSSLSVIDANWVGGRGSYVISRHIISASTLDTKGFRAYRPHEACNLTS